MAQKHKKTWLILAAWFAISLLWTILLGSYFLDRWEQQFSPVAHTYLVREQSCKASYSDQAAQERCLDIMKLERFQSHSIMIANRVLACSAPPLIGFGLIVYLRRRRSKSR